MRINTALQIVVGFMRRKPLDCAMYLLAALVLLKLGSLYIGVADDIDWDKFKIDHSCQLQTGSQRSGWLCDDGKTYYRWRQQR